MHSYSDMLRPSSGHPQGALYRKGVYTTQVNYHMDSNYNLFDHSFCNFNACSFVTFTYSIKKNLILKLYQEIVFRITYITVYIHRVSFASI